MLKETIRVFAVLLLFVIISSSQLSAQNPFNKGVNLTSWFQSGSAQEVQLYKYDLQDFEQIKSLGCDVIRLPVNLLAMTDGAPDYNLDPMFLSMMDSVVNWAENTGLHLILDNHTFDPSENTSPAIRDFLVKVWPQLANRYKNSYENLYYEILNEPHGIADATWNNIQQEVIEKIREVDAVHFLIVGPAGWNSYHNLELMPFYEDPKLIYTFHFYDPFLFTHQGASWVEPSMVPLAGVPFPYDAGAMPGMPAQFSGTWLQSAYNNYQNDGTVTKIKSLIDKINIAYQTNYSYQVVREYLEANDIAWTIWDYHGGFGLFEKNSQGLFDHDLNVDLLQALGLNQPDQTEFFIQFPSS